MFSNASCFIIYQHVLNEINKTNSEYDFFGRNQVGLVFDSTPGWPPSQFYKFTQSVYELTGSESTKNYLISAMLVLLFKTYCTIQFGNDYFSRFFRTLLHDNRENIPTLFLYSKADKLVDVNNIEKFVSDRKKLLPNLKIKSVVYEDAEHVMIYQKYPDDYLKHIKQHLELCNLNFKNQLISKL